MLILTQEQPATIREPLWGHTKGAAGTFCIQRGFDTRLNVIFYPNQQQRDMPWGVVATFAYGKGPENTPDCLDDDYLARSAAAVAEAEAFIGRAVRENWSPEGFAKESGIPKAFEMKPYGEYVLEEPERFYEGDGLYGRGPFMARPGSYPAVAEYTGGRLVNVRVLLKGRWASFDEDGEYTTHSPSWMIAMSDHLVRV